VYSLRNLITLVLIGHCDIATITYC